MVTEDDVKVEYDCLDNINRQYGRLSQYYHFQGNFTCLEMRKEIPSAFQSMDHDTNDYVSSQWQDFKARQNTLINHYLVMVKNHTIHYNLY